MLILLFCVFSHGSDQSLLRHILIEKGGSFAIRNAGHGGNSYWVVDGKRASTANVPLAEAYQFTIVKK